MSLDVLVSEEVSESYLEVHDVEKGTLVTALELLSPANKLHREHLEDYERKRQRILDSRTSLIEIDLLRAGRPMLLAGSIPPSDYRVLVSRGWLPPRAKLHAFGIRQPIPTLFVHLAPADEEPVLAAAEVLHALFDGNTIDIKTQGEEDVVASQPPVPGSEIDGRVAVRMSEVERARGVPGGVVDAEHGLLRRWIEPVDVPLLPFGLPLRFARAPIVLDHGSPEKQVNVDKLWFFDPLV